MIEELTTSMFDPDTRTVTAVRLEEMINKIDTITKALNNQKIFRPCEEEPVNTNCFWALLVLRKRKVAVSAVMA